MSGLGVSEVGGQACGVRNEMRRGGGWECWTRRGEGI